LITAEANRKIAFMVPEPLAARTGGYEYDRRIIAGLRELGWRVDIKIVDASFPQPSFDALKAAAELLAALPDRSTVVIDSLALGALCEPIGREAGRLRIVALVHLPLASEPGLAPETATARWVSDARALAASSLIVVTGRSASYDIEQHGVESSRIAVLEPGTDRVPLAQGSGQDELQLVCVATLNHGKGHRILFDALTSMVAWPWHLTCAGSLTRDVSTVDRLRTQLRCAGLEKRVTLTGELGPEELSALYHRADLFVLPTLHETYGMAVAEALARGLPIVSTRTGAIPDLLRDGAGIVVPPGDDAALARALADVVIDAALRSRLAAGARRARERLRSWEAVSRDMSDLLAGIASA
jgi:glycosyltransferase involved in cell wall biosynthesis